MRMRYSRAAAIKKPRSRVECQICEVFDDVDVLHVFQEQQGGTVANLDDTLFHLLLIATRCPSISRHHPLALAY